MKVAFNASSLTGPLTGIGQYSYNLAKALINKKIDMELFYRTYWEKRLIHQQTNPKYQYRAFIRNNIPFSYEFARMASQLRFDQGLKKLKPDIYHEPNFLAFKSDLPTIITVHDLSWIKHPEVHPKSRVKAMNKYFEKGLSHAEMVITDSNYIREEVINTLGFPKEKIVAIPLGFDAIFKPREINQTQSILSHYSLHHGKYILAVGTIEPRKNLQTALRAFIRLPKKLRLQYPLVIVGMNGWLNSALEKELHPLMTTGEVRLLGYVSRSDLATIYSGALSLVFPSIYEGFGLPPLEAMASGIPVIASNTSSIPEVIGDSSVLVNPYDIDGFFSAIELLINDSNTRNQLSIKALNRSKQFSWDLCAQATFDVYQQVKNNSLVN
jgi:glycosyltransferase involved in cell wall biosynthesis